jgi:hypothetical protein
MVCFSSEASLATSHNVYYVTLSILFRKLALSRLIAAETVSPSLR